MGVADHGTTGQTTAAPSLAAWATSVAAALNDSDVTVDARIAAHEADTTSVHGIADTAALVTNARTVTAGAGLTGGGSLAADRTFDVGAGTGITVTADAVAVTFGSTAGTAAQGNDARLSDARTPVAHAASHAAAGSDPVTVAQSQVTNLTTDLAAKAPLSSPALTGTPTVPTASVDTNTTQVATTAFVLAQASATSPVMDGTAAAGSATRWARSDHVHPSDTTRHLISRATFSNADATCASATRFLAQTGTMSAARTVTMPAANAVPAGTEIIVADESGTVTATNSLTVQRAGSDTIDGATSTVIESAYGWRRFVSDGSSKWTFDGGLIRGSSFTAANTILAAPTRGAPAALTVGASTLVGRAATGNIAALSPATTRTDFDLAQASTVGNLLTANQASGTDTLGTTAGFVSAGSSFASTTDQARTGSRSLAITTLSSAPEGIYFGGTGSGVPASGTIPVSAIPVVNASVWVKSSAAEQIMVRIYWWTAAGNVAASTPYTAGTTVTTTTSGWTLVDLAATPPSDAAYAGVYLRRVSGTAGTIHYADCFGFWAGAGGDWAMPGTPITNLGRKVSHPNTDDVLVQTWDSSIAAPAWQTAWYDTGRRSLTLANGWTATSAILRRTCSTVELVFVGLNGASATSGTVVTLDAAFRPSYAILGGVGTSASVLPTNLLTVNTSGTVVVGGTYTGVTAGSASIRLNTDATRPSSLPGTLVSSAPA